MESDIGSGFHWRVVYGIGHWIRLSLESSIWNHIGSGFHWRVVYGIGHWIRLSLGEYKSDIGSGFHWRVVYGIGHWIRLSLESSIWNRTLDQAFTGE